MTVTITPSGNGLGADISGVDLAVATPEDIDARICAEFPDPSDPAQAELLSVISTSQVHGPCGARNPQCVCMEDGACTKGYPKNFAETTQLNEDGLGW